MMGSGILVAQESEGKKARENSPKDIKIGGLDAPGSSVEARPKGQLRVNEATTFPLLASASCHEEHTTDKIHKAAICSQLRHARHLIGLQ